MIDCILQIVNLSHIIGLHDLFYCLKLSVFFNLSAPPPTLSNPPSSRNKDLFVPPLPVRSLQPSLCGCRAPYLNAFHTLGR